MTRKCLDCGQEFTGRSDKKFCSDYCRNNYNNRLNSQTNSYVRNINYILRKNRRILNELNLNGKTKLHKDKLIAKGYNFNYHTNTYTTKKGSTYYFCYEQGYVAIDNDYLLLVKRDDIA
jgi:hypothetical protein